MKPRKPLEKTRPLWVAPLTRAGRGLKPTAKGGDCADLGRPAHPSGARIETYDDLVKAALFAVAPLTRAGRGLKLGERFALLRELDVAPLTRAGRGLKHEIAKALPKHLTSPRSPERGAD